MGPKKKIGDFFTKVEERPSGGTLKRSFGTMLEEDGNAVDDSKMMVSEIEAVKDDAQNVPSAQGSRLQSS